MSQKQKPNQKKPNQANFRKHRYANAGTAASRIAEAIEKQEREKDDVQSESQA